VRQFDANRLQARRAAVFKDDGSVIDVVRGWLTDETVQMAAPRERAWHREEVFI
jgi:hypothetical protein